LIAFKIGASFLFVQAVHHDGSLGPEGSLIKMPRKKKAYVRLTQDYDALDVANRIGII